MTAIEIEAHIRDFLTNNFIFDPSFQLGSNDSLMENGVIDSTGVLELIMWLETNFDITVGDNEVLPENLDAVYSLTNYVQRKLMAGMAALS
ncbi:MAG: acyl carrier protein [Chloroflexi bacterium]|nr:acyl carrier protein [Chloroflexota bacterium]